VSAVTATTRATKARQLLDARFAKADKLRVLLARPARGWVRSVREALGMSQAELAARLGVNQKTVHSLEAGELAGTVQLATLVRAAEALGCDVVYALVPRVPLHKVVQQRLLELAVEQAVSVHQTMLLEDQLPVGRDELVQQLVDDLAAHPVPLWRDPQAVVGRTRR
jgi:predicted DNA-binding mobile mystery protein A